jgi:hypothetical protein
VLKVRFGIRTAAMRRETDMDSGFTIKPRPGVIPRSHALRDPVTVREAVDTELDPTKVVTAAGDGEAKHDNSPHDEASAREVTLDPLGREALFSAIDVRAEHTEQSPQEALMHLRAYRQHTAHHEARADKLADDAAVVDQDPHADIEA